MSSPSNTRFSSKKLVYSKYGDSMSELQLAEEQLLSTEIKPGEAFVKVIYSPINPSDILTVEGYYPVKPSLPAIPGIEGVVEVVHGTTFKPGDRALISDMSWGKWRQFGIVDEKYLVKMPTELPLEAAATLVVNPCTAYLMLKHVANLKPGDVIIHNGANSALGQVIIQLAKASGIKTINVIRDRPNLKETVDMLKALGADVVITDVDLKKGLKTLNLGLPEPKLALECIGGPNAADLAASLCNGGTMVIYGVLSGQPVQLYQTDFIFRRIHVRGFWLKTWIESNSPQAFQKVLDDLISLYIGGKLKLPSIRKFPLEQWREAVQQAKQSFKNEKVMLQLN